MQHTILGSTGVTVSRFAFGAMTFGNGTLVPGVENDIGQSAANDMVALCLDYGVNLFDTADAYTSGQSEIMLGKALGKRRSEVLIATKFGFRNGGVLTERGASYRYVMSAMEASLGRLGTDYIDLYFQHIPDPWTPLEQTLRALEDATRQGKIRYAGVSNVPAWQVAKMLGIQKAEGWSPLQVTQLYYSLLGRDLEDGYGDFLRDAGLGLMTWSPLASGYLTGKYTGNAAKAGRRQAFEFPPVDADLGDRVVGVLRELGEARDATPAQIALAWQLSRPWVSSVIVGATSLAQLEANLKAATLVLESPEVARLDEVSAFQPRYPQWMQGMARDQKTAQSLGE